MDEKKLIHARRHVSQTQFIAYGFFCIIITGTLLLMLPFASRDGQSEPFLNCLFTATSASCVTGLVVADTWSQWSLFGQLVILTMIQIGGLGFITVGVFISIVLRRKIGLKERGLMMESVNTLQIGGVVRLAKKIIIGTCIFEGTGAVLLAIRFIPQFGFLRGLFYGIFHSISAFCNAGFDLMGGQTPYSSFVAYYDDWLVNLVIMSLIIIGGIGFIVWDDLSRNKLHFRKYMLQTKIVLVTTAILVFGGGLLFYLLERNHLDLLIQLRDGQNGRLQHDGHGGLNRWKQAADHHPDVHRRKPWLHRRRHQDDDPGGPSLVRTFQYQADVRDQYLRPEAGERRGQACRNDSDDQSFTGSHGVAGYHGDTAAGIFRYPV